MLWITLKSHLMTIWSSKKDACQFMPDKSKDDPKKIIIILESLRGSSKVKNGIIDNKYDHLSFRYFFPRLISKLHLIMILNLDPEAFKLKINFLSK